MRLLAFSDLHRDLDAARSLVERSARLRRRDRAPATSPRCTRASRRRSSALAAIETPTMLVPGNNETEDALREACAGLGGGRPSSTASRPRSTASRSSASARASRRRRGTGASTSATRRRRSGSRPVRRAPCSSSTRRRRGTAIAAPAATTWAATRSSTRSRARQPPLAVCGHIHEAWGERSQIGPTEIANLGPARRRVRGLRGKRWLTTPTS